MNASLSRSKTPRRNLQPKPSSGKQALCVFYSKKWPEPCRWPATASFFMRQYSEFDAKREFAMSRTRFSDFTLLSTRHQAFCLENLPRAIPCAILASSSSCMSMFRAMVLALPLLRNPTYHPICPLPCCPSRFSRHKVSSLGLPRPASDGVRWPGRTWKSASSASNFVRNANTCAIAEIVSVPFS